MDDNDQEILQDKSLIPLTSYDGVIQSRYKGKMDREKSGMLLICMIVWNIGIEANGFCTKRSDLVSRSSTDCIIRSTPLNSIES
jgi:hypothetical protein